MKFRYVLALLTGILITILVFTVTSVATYAASSYKFLGINPPKRVSLEPDPIGWVGREARYFVRRADPAVVGAEAAAELTAIGWTQKSASPQVFRRGDHELIDVRGADQYNDKRLLRGIPAADLKNHTVIKVIDPRMSPAIRLRFERMARRLEKLHGKHIG